jgi:HEAT repeat protein
MKTKIILIIFILGFVNINLTAEENNPKYDKNSLYNICLNTLVNGLYSNEKNVCIESIKLIGQLKDTSLIPHLKKLLANQDDDIRLETSFSLIKLGDKSSYNNLINILRNNPLDNQLSSSKPIERAKSLMKQNTRIRAAEMMGEIGEKIFINVLLTIANNKYEYGPLIDKARISLAKLGDRTKINSFIYALHSDDKNIRAEACKALGELKEKSVLNNLIELLKYWDKNVRIQACSALAKIGDERAAESISTLLIDKDPEIRMVACEALGKLKSTKYIANLKELLSKDENGFVRIAAAESLLNLNDNSGESLLLKTINSQDFDAKLKSIQILGNYGTKNILSILEKNFYSEKNEILKLNISYAIIQITNRLRASETKQ